MDILSPLGLARVAFTLIKTVDKNLRVLWKTPASIFPTFQGG